MCKKKEHQHNASNTMFALTNIFSPYSVCYRRCDYVVTKLWVDKVFNLGAKILASLTFVFLLVLAFLASVSSAQVSPGYLTR